MSELDEWQRRVDAFWAAFDDSEPERMRAEMRALVGERPAEDATALAEWGSVHDALGLEADAVGPYRSALAAGLDPERAHQVTLQLASTLRNLGEYEAAVELLTDLEAPELGDAPAAFLALALHSAGRADEALATALTALAPHLPRYGRAAAAYAAELVGDAPE
ncbi:tetratricopeptide repeat protein [Gryllotalpicola reticulitermitis]|uniref:Tetratricopeptide repeat protein n=1 Tax=Gryllotalpicola reticulitermitis TaxID=1184153 RepID=A0ABV8Q8Y2_9MICO